MKIRCGAYGRAMRGLNADWIEDAIKKYAGGVIDEKS